MDFPDFDEFESDIEEYEALMESERDRFPEQHDTPISKTLNQSAHRRLSDSFTPQAALNAMDRSEDSPTPPRRSPPAPTTPTASKPNTEEERQAQESNQQADYYANAFEDLLKDDDVCGDEGEAAPVDERLLSRAQKLQRQLHESRQKTLMDRPPGGPFWSVTSPDCTKLGYYQSTPAVAFEKDLKSQWRQLSSMRDDLLAVSVSALQEEMDKEDMQKAHESAEDFEFELQQNKLGDAGGIHIEQGEQLWVDKYAAKSFIDLLSDERVNRQSLEWLRAWDHVVFKKPIRPVQPPPLLDDEPFNAEVSASKREMKTIHSMPKYTPRSKRRRRPQPTFRARPSIVANDGKPPEQRVLLFCGPPGTGKTTLAHVIARHAGYNVMEINASDDRTAKKLTERVRNATEMNTIMGGQRPNLVVLDEIDGSLGGADGQNAVAALVQLVEGKEGKGKSKVSPLNRPLICVCNDQWAPAMRPLRKIARIFVFKPTNKTSLRKRLEFVCKREKFGADTSALNLLAEMTEFDIRASLNTLQFAKSQQVRLGAVARFTVKQLKRMDVGQKDFSKDLFKVWNELCTKHSSGPKTNARLDHAPAVKAASPTQATASKASKLAKLRWTHLNRLMSSLNDSNAVFSGLHEHFLNLGFPDATMSTTVSALDWMCHSDLLTRAKFQNQFYFVGGYIPYAAIAVHELCAQDRRYHMRFPRQAQQLRQTLSKNTVTLQHFIAGAAHDSCARSKGGNARALAMEVVPFLFSALCRALPEKDISVMSQSEQFQVQDTARLFLTYGLDYRLTGDGDGEGYTEVQHLRLEPPIDDVLRFSWDVPDQALRFAVQGVQPRFSPSRRANQGGGTQPGNTSNKNTRVELPEETKRTLAVAAQKMRLSHSSELEGVPSHVPVPTTTSSIPPTPILKKHQGLTRVQNMVTPDPKRQLKNGDAQSTTSSAPFTQTPDGGGEFGEKQGKTFKATPGKGARHSFMKRRRGIKRVRYPIHFRYQEGFTQAVRRTVYMKDFL